MSTGEGRAATENRLAAVTALVGDRGRVARNLRFLVEGAAGKHCIACDHVRHNELAYCQVGQCPCSEGVTVASTAAIILRDLRAALTTPAPAPVETLACPGGHLGHRRGIGCVRPDPAPVDDHEALAAVMAEHESCDFSITDNDRASFECGFIVGPVVSLTDAKDRHRVAAVLAAGYVKGGSEGGYL